MKSERFDELVRSYRDEPRPITEIGLSAEAIGRVAAWLFATFGDVKVVVEDFGTEESRLNLARRCGQQELSAMIAHAYQQSKADE
jgi:hypothetical protein